MNPGPRRPTHRQVWMLAGPMIISNISVPLVGAVDTAVVGHLPGLHHIGAVAIGALIFSFLYWGFGFLKMGVTGYVARAHGAGDTHAIGRTVLQFLLMSAALGVLVILLRQPLINVAMALVDAGESVETLAAQYSGIRIWSAPATLCVYVFTGIFVGLHKTHLALVLQLALNLTNVALDLLFVPVLELGVPGVAWASLIAEYAAMLLGLWLLRPVLRAAFANRRRGRILDAASLRDVARTNGNIFIRTVCVIFAFAFFTAQSAKQGELVLAVNTVLLHLQTMMACALDGFAHATEALAGSASGAGERARFRRAVRLTTAWAGAAALLISLGYLAGGEWIVGLFTNNPEVTDTAAVYLGWMIIAPLVSFLSFQADGLFVGVGRAREMRNAMLVSTACYLACAVLLQPLLGNHGLFLALTCFMILRALTLGAYYPRVLRSVHEH